MTTPLSSLLIIRKPKFLLTEPTPELYYNCLLCESEIPVHFNTGEVQTIKSHCCDNEDCHAVHEITITGGRNGTTSIVLSEQRRGVVLDLLKLNVQTAKPVYIVVKGSLAYKADENIVEKLASKGWADKRTYLYRDHHCPKNYLGFPVLEGSDADPHGLFSWVQSIPLPAGYDPVSFGQEPGEKDLDVWKRHFSALRP